MTPAGHPIPDDAMIQRAEALLESLTAVVSARVLFDEERVPRFMSSLPKRCPFQKCRWP